MKEFIKKFIPTNILGSYHYTLAILAKWFYGDPSKKLLIIGVTGTAGKSTTCYFIAQMLNGTGTKTGLTTTTVLNNGRHEWLNDKKMTMLGRFQTQKLLSQMVKNNCQAAVIETSSQGIEQYRHIGINYDILVLTNLYPEHIEAHGGFENYKQAKGKLFEHLSKQKHKKQLIKNKDIKKTILVNLDDDNAEYFLNFPAERKIGFSLNQKSPARLASESVAGREIRNQVEEIIYYNNNWEFELLGEYNKYNILPAVAIARQLKINEEQINKAIKNLKPLPGRLEFIPNNHGFQIIVDYSFEPEALAKLYEAVKDIPRNKIIHVLGSTGGGRDKARRPLLGKLAAEKADIVIVTNEDPYDENPETIINEVISGALKDNNQDTRYKSQKNYKLQITRPPCYARRCGRTNYKILYKILNRREAIQFALKLAGKNDLILITGKGAEQAMCVANGKKIKWDDRVVVKEELAKMM